MAKEIIEDGLAKQPLIKKRWFKITAISLGVVLFLFILLIVLTKTGIIPKNVKQNAELSVQGEVPNEKIMIETKPAYACPDQTYFKDGDDKTTYALFGESERTISGEEDTWIQNNCPKGTFTGKRRQTTGVPPKSSSTTAVPKSSANSSAVSGTDTPVPETEAPAIAADNPPVLKNLMVSFGRYDESTGRAGAFILKGAASKRFFEFGVTLDSGVANPAFEYLTALDAAVYAAADGVVTEIGSQGGNSEIIVRTSESSRWFVSYDHVSNPSVSKGDKITAGQVLGTAGDAGGVGNPELQVARYSDDYTSATNYCPFNYMSSSLAAEYKQKMRDLMIDTETVIGNPELYDETKDPPGCLKSSF